MSIQDLHQLGQSLWYDNIQRRLLENGELETLIERGDIRGVTSNPAIFHNAIAKSNDYDSALIPLAWSGWDAEKIFWQLAVEDIQQACDLFATLYGTSKGGDGYVSLEVSPYLAHDTKKTILQAEALWRRVNRPNLMIKIPATPEGIPAIRQAIAKGINVNVTLIFSLARYSEVIEAYLSGLEERVRTGQSVEQVASVASFFISRVDTKVDALLRKDLHLRGQAAIANARLAYAAFLETFSGERWEALRLKGAQFQRPLWASTSTKNPNYPDTLYVDALIGAHTVNTVPPHTLEAYRAHGLASESILQDKKGILEVIDRLEAAGISIGKVTQELEDEGVQAFADAFTALLEAIQERRESALRQLGRLATPVSKRIKQVEADGVPARLWEGDPALWTTDPTGQAEVRKRLGWLWLPEASLALLPELNDIADQVHYEGINRILVLGMGGSSLAPEVLSEVFADAEPQATEGKPYLSILDSTDPAQVAWAVEKFPPEKSIYLVSSKSGGTVEVSAMMEYFWERSGKDGTRFIAITDPGTALEELAKQRGFRKVFLANPDVGGRYSALGAFGLAPAALLGLDLKRLLERAAWMMEQSRADVPAARNPGLALGVVIAEATLSGRDKLTILADPLLATFGSWLEQLLAESSGKHGVGIIPVDREPMGALPYYKKDRLFVYLRQTGEFDHQIAALQEAGQPALVIDVSDAYDLGAEFYRWEIATAVACHLLGVNAFDQPNVEDAKIRARTKVAERQEGGCLPAGESVALPEVRSSVKKLFSQARQGDYVAILAYLPRTSEMVAILQEMRVAIIERTELPTTLGFGPRYLHSTGQLHKGGANNGLFFQITADPVQDIQIPAQSITFGALELAQALGDFEALKASGRRILRVHLQQPEEITDLLQKIQS